MKTRHQAETPQDRRAGVFFFRRGRRRGGFTSTSIRRKHGHWWWSAAGWNIARPITPSTAKRSPFIPSSMWRADSGEVKLKGRAYSLRAGRVVFLWPGRAASHHRRPRGPACQILRGFCRTRTHLTCCAPAGLPPGRVTEVFPPHILAPSFDELIQAGLQVRRREHGVVRETAGMSRVADGRGQRSAGRSGNPCLYHLPAMPPAHRATLSSVCGRWNKSPASVTSARPISAACSGGMTTKVPTNICCA